MSSARPRSDSVLRALRGWLAHACSARLCILGARFGAGAVAGTVKTWAHSARQTWTAGLFTPMATPRRSAN